MKLKNLLGINKIQINNWNDYEFYENELKKLDRITSRLSDVFILIMLLMIFIYLFSAIRFIPTFTLFFISVAGIVVLVIIDTVIRIKMKNIRKELEW